MQSVLGPLYATPSSHCLCVRLNMTNLTTIMKYVIASTDMHAGTNRKTRRDWLQIYLGTIERRSMLAVTPTHRNDVINSGFVMCSSDNPS